MRILLYVLSLLAGAYVLQGVLMALMVGTIVNLQSSPHPLMGAFFVLPYLLPLMLLVGRGYLWFKRKRIAVPASFGWFSYAVSCIAAGAVVLTSAGYAVLMLMGEGGLSGIPLGLVLMLCVGWPCRSRCRSSNCGIGGRTDGGSRQRVDPRWRGRRGEHAQTCAGA
jgi:hypothetical protein